MDEVKNQDERRRRSAVAGHGSADQAPPYSDAYRRDDPKSPGWYERMADRADRLRKEERGE